MFTEPTGKYTSSEVVHHRNKDKTDNRLENLELHDHASHLKLHIQEKHAGWSLEADRCVSCGSSERPHKAYNLCERCYKRSKNPNVGAMRKRKIGGRLLP